MPRPWLRVNFVAGLDGAAAVDGLSAGLSSATDKQVFKVLRRNCDALLVGAGTFRAENYRALTLDAERRSWRVARGLDEYPQMIVVSKSLALDPGHPALAEAPRRALILTTGNVSVPAELSNVAEVWHCADLTEGVALLHAQGLTQILCEGGPLLFGALLERDLVDELCLTLAPLLTGDGAGRIVRGEPHPPRAMKLGHVLTADDGMVLLRYERDRR